jgi:uncharacterized protein (TIGR02145 family)
MKNAFRILAYCTFIAVVLSITSCKKDPPTKPVISTTDITAITVSTASAGGNISSDGGAAIISRGVCWSTGSSPTTSDNTSNDGSGIGTFTSNLVNLSTGTNYSVRAYATNSAGTAYGLILKFTTLGLPPAPTVAAASDITITSATINGGVNANFLSTTITFEYGLTSSYGTSIAATQSPLTGNTNTNVSAAITGLTTGTTYHYRIKAVNSMGTIYSDDMTFKTLGAVPSATAQAATNLQVNSATLNGSVNANYFSTTVTFEWGTDYGYGNTVIPAQSPVTGGTPVNVSAVLTGLTEGTNYYFRISATNELGTTKSEGIKLTTPAKPTLTTVAISEVTTTSAVTGGNITSDFGSLVSEKGICWSTSHNPTTSGNKIISNSQTGNYSVNITGLTPNSTYYIRAYATNSIGTGYGSELILKTFTGTISDIDGNLYHTVTIGTQIWMAENLKTTKYQSGALIGTTTPAQLDITAESNPKYQWPVGADEGKVATYGRLYTWYAITDGRNVCPVGWHIPTNAEWLITSNFLGGVSVAGSKLREAGLIHYTGDNSDATNESGFTALPAGYRNQEGYFGGMYDNTGIWTSTPRSATEAYPITLNPGSTYIGFNTPFTMNFGFSVRCVKD